MGVGVVQAEGDELSLVNADVLKVSRRLEQPKRLYCLHKRLLEYIARFKPDEIAIEQPFVARNVRSAMAVGQAQALAMIAAAAADISVLSYAPREVKLAVTGFGHSTKEQVQEMVILTLGASDHPMPLDASDALAVAICHINSQRANALIQEERT